MSASKSFFLLLFTILTYHFLGAEVQSQLIKQKEQRNEIHQVVKDKEYIFCIDSGGSRTSMMVLNKEGKALPLTRKGVLSFSVSTTGANINFVGARGVSKVVRELFNDLRVGHESIPLYQVFDRSAIVAGMGGLGRDKDKNTVFEIFCDYGFYKDNIYISSDAELSMELIPTRGLILISGTGSICFGKDGNKLIRVGGLGRVFGDEGSGYYIGLEALRATISEEYGFASPTSLTARLRKHFEVNELKNLVGPINTSELNPASIAAIAPIVFEEAEEGDTIAKEIIHLSTESLGKMLSKGMDLINDKNATVYLIGGIFQNSGNDQFLENLLNSSYLTKDSKVPQLINVSRESIAALAAKETLKRIDGVIHLDLIDNSESL